jgi:cytochrome c553
MRTRTWVAAVAAALVASPVFAAEGGHSGGMKGDAEAGKKVVKNGMADNPMVMACQSCHGLDGKGNASANFPRLAGQNQEYMIKQLQDFASGARANYPTMKSIAQGMMDENNEPKDVAYNVGAYYAQQDVTVSGADADESTLKMGERIANRGVPDKNVPACTSCHGPKGQGVPPVFPQIAGQHGSYITKQLNDWEKGDRKNDPAKMMQEIAPKLSKEQRKAVGAYFSHVQM